MTSHTEPDGSETTLLVIAKEPVPGRVKTRLSPPWTLAQAAELAEAALRDTLYAVAATPARRRVLVLDGRPGPWLPKGFEVVPQRGAGLDERLANAFAEVEGPAFVVGMDTPQLTPRHLTVDWHDVDAYFGPAADGGFWGLGLREPDPALLLGVPMSTSHTGARQRDRLVSADLRIVDLPELRDVDTVDDAREVAAAAPATRFASTVRRLSVETSSDLWFPLPVGAAS